MKLLSILPLSFLLVPFVANAELRTVEVFYDSASKLPLSEVDGIMPNAYQLSNSKHLLADINKRIPNNFEDAKIVAKDLFNQQEGKSAIKALVDSYQSIGKAYQYGLTKLPAVVINGRFVVYGTTDVKSALILWRNNEA